MSETIEGEALEVVEEAPQDPYGDPVVAVGLQRAYAWAADQAGSAQSVRQYPDTRQWWVTVNAPSRPGTLCRQACQD